MKQSTNFKLNYPVNALAIHEKPLPLPAGNARVVVFSSGLRGVGKSHLIASLGSNLLAQGKRVCLIDADSHQSNLTALLNISSPYSLEQVLSGQRQIEDVLATGSAGLQVVSSASGLADFTHLNRPRQERLLSAIQRLESRFDYLLIDTAADSNDEGGGLFQAAHHGVITVTTESNSLTGAFSQIKALKRRGLKKPISIVVNMAPSAAHASVAYMRLKRVVAKHLGLDLRLLGYVLTDPALKRSEVQQKSVVLNDPSSVVNRCVQNLSNRLEKYLQHPEEDALHFSSFWGERLKPVKAKPIIAAEAGWEIAIESVRCFMQAEESSAEETEALLLELTLAWVARFGHAPSSLRDLFGGGDVSHIETKPEVAHRTELEADKSGVKTMSRHPPIDSNAGLQQAMHYARLLAKSEAP